METFGKFKCYNCKKETDILDIRSNHRNGTLKVVYVCDCEKKKSKKRKRKK
jgi:hypothetical protein